jgi:hypothetical protein
MNEDGQGKRVEHKISEHMAFKLSPQLKAQFVAHVQSAGTSFSLSELLVRPETLSAVRTYDAELKKRGMTAPRRPPDELVDMFSLMYSQIIPAGERDTTPRVLVRWLKASNESHLKRIVEGLDQNGGKVGELVGVCMSELGSKADDTIQMQMSRGEDFGVLMIYDASKLDALSPQESRSDSNFYAGYGYKPKPGQTFKTALLGSIAM